MEIYGLAQMAEGSLSLNRLKSDSVISDFSGINRMNHTHFGMMMPGLLLKKVMVIYGWGLMEG